MSLDWMSITLPGTLLPEFHGMDNKPAKKSSLDIILVMEITHLPQTLIIRSHEMELWSLIDTKRRSRPWKAQGAAYLPPIDAMTIVGAFTPPQSNLLNILPSFSSWTRPTSKYCPSLDINDHTAVQYHCIVSHAGNLILVCSYSHSIVSMR